MINVNRYIDEAAYRGRQIPEAVGWTRNNLHEANKHIDDSRSNANSAKRRIEQILDPFKRSTNNGNNYCDIALSASEVKELMGALSGIWTNVNFASSEALMAKRNIDTAAEYVNAVNHKVANLNNSLSAAINNMN